MRHLLVFLIASTCSAAIYPAVAASETTITPSLNLTEIHSANDWEKARLRLLEAWQRILGPFPESVPLNAKEVNREIMPDHTRILLTYQTEPGRVTDAYLLIPHGLTSPAPAAIVFHATSSNHILQTVGLADKPTRHLALQLVRRGYVTLTPRCYIYGAADVTETTRPATPKMSTKDYAAKAHSLMKQEKRRTGMGKMLWDGMKALDYLITRPEVDRNRIAALGHSLGAKEAFYLLAFDGRLTAAIASEGGTGIHQTNWDAPWYLGEQVSKPGFQRDHDEVIALAAPRPFLIIGGGASDGPATTPLVESARRVYKLYQAEKNLELLIHQDGHEITDIIRDKSYDWLALKLSKSAPAYKPPPLN